VSTTATAANARADVGACEGGCEDSIATSDSTATPEEVLARLRGDGEGRPVVDPGLAWGLRDWLEDSLAPAAAALPDELPALRVTKEVLDQVLVCEAHAASRADAARVVTFEMSRGALVGALFRQWVTVGRFSEPFEDALGAVGCTDEAVAGFVSSLERADRGRLAREVRAHATAIESSWPLFSPAWLARTRERLEVPLAGGRIVLGGTVDLALGAPCTGRASVCLVELQSGARRIEHRPDLHYLALLETLRSGAPPFRIATYYSATGELEAEEAGEDVLLGALERALAGTQRLCRLASGAPTDPARDPMCAWCAATAHGRETGL